jgi:hypothetical protein
MQSAKSGVSRVPGLPAKLISAPEASIRKLSRSDRDIYDND